MRKVVPILRMKQRIGRSIALAGNPIGDVHTHRMAAGHDAGARRAADGAGGVSLRKAHTALGQAIDIGGLVKLAAIGPDVCPAHVVHEKKQEVGLLSVDERRYGCNENREGAESQGGKELIAVLRLRYTKI